MTLCGCISILFICVEPSQHQMTSTVSLPYLLCLTEWVWIHLGGCHPLTLPLSLPLLFACQDAAHESLLGLIPAVWQEISLSLTHLCCINYSVWYQRKVFFRLWGCIYTSASDFNMWFSKCVCLSVCIFLCVSRGCLLLPVWHDADTLNKNKCRFVKADCFHPTYCACMCVHACARFCIPPMVTKEAGVALGDITSDTFWG